MLSWAAECDRDVAGKDAEAGSIECDFRSLVDLISSEQGKVSAQGQRARSARNKRVRCDRWRAQIEGEM